MDKKEITKRASKAKRKRKVAKIVKLALFFLLLLLLTLYIVIGIVYGSGSFTIRLDKNLYFEKGIIVYDDPEYKVYRAELYAQPVEALDNISHKWLPEDIHENVGGTHNGDNYIAYTFYVENIGEQVADYWSEITIDHVIKNVVDAVRIRVYKNGEYITYAKIAGNGEPEPDTLPFEEDSLVERVHVEDFSPGDINKYTIIIWLEGNDPDCTDNILGGEIKTSMSFNSEFVEEIEGEM